MYDKRQRMVYWHRRDAEQLANRLRPLIGQYVILSGGGSRSYWCVAKLRDVRIRDARPIEGTDAGMVHVRAYLVAGERTSQEGARGLPSSEATEEDVNIGSWRISAIKRRES